MDPKTKEAVVKEVEKNIGANPKLRVDLRVKVTDGVKAIVKEEVEHGRLQLEKHMERLVAPKASTIVVKTPTNEKAVTGLRHRLFPKILRMVGTKTPTYLWGAAGAGKTTLAFQIAEALGLKFYPVYGGPTLTESKLLGYKNASTGHYVKGLCYDSYVTGGLLFMDEADVGEGLIGLNALLANDVYRFPDGEVVTRHKDFHVLAAGNTNWNGATGSYKRQAADGAFKDRFVRMRFEYDEALEMALVPPEFAPWVKYVHEVRAYVNNKTKEGRAIISPRAILKGWQAIACGAMDIREAAETIVMVDLSDDVRQVVIREVKMPELKITKE